MRASASHLSFLFFVLLIGCQRRLPGPDECRSFALASVGVEPRTSSDLLAQSQPELYARAEQLTRQCLTTPWDYALMSCVSRGGSSRACLRSFEARRLGQSQ